MISLKISVRIILMLFCSCAVFSQTNIDIFKSSMKDCKIKWLEEDQKDDTFEVILDSTSNHKEIIRFKLIDDIAILKDQKSINQYIKDIYYTGLEILHNALGVKTEDTNLTLYLFAIKNGEAAPKRDKHTIKNICGSYYLISYFSMYGMGEETF